MADTLFNAKATLKEGLQVECTARDFSIILDEPVSLGGTDTGMNPVEALLSALGGCKCIVARAFAKKHKINLKNVEIELEGTLDPDGFLGRNPDAKIGFSRIVTKFKIEADNTKEEIEKYVEFIESNCPVQDTLTNAAEFETVIV
ncbi:MAG TPA: OsmC family protein [Clostridia bacterium]|jgi:uncharacterized OsmC-like protein|nr:OsmC family protein [Clostridia bacterium]HPZ51572.1 OsmC family protein [Clostridia bacterium]